MVKAWLCPHTDRRHSAKGMCNQCYSAKLYRENRDRILKRNTDRYFKNPKAHRDYIRFWRYGVSPERFNEILSAQGGLCAVCKGPLGEKPHIDHSHACCPGPKSCGKCVRGIICCYCNHLVGYLEGPHVVAAADYIESF